MGFLDRIKNAKNEVVKIVKNIFTEEQQHFDEQEQKHINEQEQQRVVTEKIRKHKNKISRYGKDKIIDCQLNKNESLLKYLTSNEIEYIYSDDEYLIFTCPLKSKNEIIGYQPKPNFIDYRNEPDFVFFEDDEIDSLQFDFTANDVLSKIESAKLNSQFDQAFKNMTYNQHHEKMKGVDGYEL